MQSLRCFKLHLGQFFGLLPHQLSAKVSKPLFGFVADACQCGAQGRRRGVRTRNHIAQVLVQRKGKVSGLGVGTAVHQRQQLCSYIVVHVGIDALALHGCGVLSRLPQQDFMLLSLLLDLQTRMS